MPRRPAITHGGPSGDLSYDDDLVFEGPQMGADPNAYPAPSVAGNEFMTPGTDLVMGPNGQVMTGPAITTGNIQSRQHGVPTPDAPVEEPMTDSEVLAVIDAELSNCAAQYSGELAENRIEALRFYDGKMPTAPAGRSNAVSTDVADVIEWIKPQIVNALTSGDVVQLIAEGEDDEEAAQLETDACEHVIFRENSGFLYVYSCTTDALLQKNGIGKVYFDEETSVTVERYEGLTEPEVAMLLQPQDGSTVKPMEYSEYIQDGIVDLQGQPITFYDVKVNRYRQNGGVRVDPMPPEEFLIARDHQSIIVSGARFSAHKRIVTESQLIAEGWPEDMVRDLPTYSVDETGEREERRTLEDEKDFGYDASDRAVRRIQHIECYCKVDQDRDGIAEMKKVDVAGSGSYYLMGIDDVDDNPFVGCTTNLRTHKFYGTSIYDRLCEIQHQKTEIVRAIQDNLKHQNNSRLLVVAGQVNLDDLLTSRPGGVVRQKQPGMVEPLTAPQIGDLGYRQLEYLDNVRTGRAGVSPDTASVAEAIAGDTAHGLERLMSAKEELTGLMIELMAETLMKGTVFKVRKLLQMHRDTPMHFKVRGKWQAVNPAEWSNRTGADVQPGLGNGDRLKRMKALTAIGQQQAQAWSDPELRGVMVTPENLFATATEFVRATNIKDPSPFWQDPQSPEAQQALRQRQQSQQQMEQMQQQQVMWGAQMQMMIEREKETTKRLQIQQDTLESQSKLILEYQKLEAQKGMKYTELELVHGQDIPGEGMEAPKDG